MDKKEMVEQIVARVAAKLAEAGETVTTKQEETAASDPSLLGLLILTQEHGTDCHRLLESSRIREHYHTGCALLQDGKVSMDQIETVVLFQLTIDAMCKLASGIVDTPYTRLAAEALLTGKRLYVPREEVELYRYPAKGLGSYQCMLQAKLTKLVSWGLKICPLAQLEEELLGGTTEQKESSACQMDEACGTDSDAAKETEEEVSREAPAKPEEKEITFTKRVITERDVIEANRENVKVIHITERNILTALAKDAASSRNIRLVRD